VNTAEFSDQKAAAAAKESAATGSDDDNSLVQVSDVDGISSSGNSVNNKMLTDLKDRADKWENRAAGARAKEGIKEPDLTPAQKQAADAAAKEAADAYTAEAGAWAVSEEAVAQDNKAKRQADAVWARYKQEHPRSSEKASAEKRERTAGTTDAISSKEPSADELSAPSVPASRPYSHDAADDEEKAATSSQAVTPSASPAHTDHSATLGTVQDVLNSDETEEQKVEEIKQAVSSEESDDDLNAEALKTSEDITNEQARQSEEAQNEYHNKVASTLDGEDEDEDGDDDKSKSEPSSHSEAIGSHTAEDSSSTSEDGSSQRDREARNAIVNSHEKIIDDVKDQLEQSREKIADLHNELNGSAGSSDQSSVVPESLHSSDDTQTETAIKNAMVSAAQNAVEQAKAKTVTVAESQGVGDGIAQGVATNAVKEAAQNVDHGSGYNDGSDTIPNSGNVA